MHEIGSKEKERLASENFLKTGKFPISTQESDTRPSKEVVAILVDFSYSMTASIGNPLKSKLDLAKQIFGTFVDKTKGYDCPHDIAFVAFGEDSNIICQPTRDYDVVEEEFGRFAQTSSFTNLYGGILTCLDMLETYKTDNKAILPTTCIFRVVCLTDGEDNRSQARPYDLASKMRQSGIKFDAFVLGNSDFSEMRKMANSTGGWCFSKDANLDEIVQRECVISFSERYVADPPPLTTQNWNDFANQTKYPDITIPKRREHPKINAAAKNNPRVSMSSQGMSRSNKILRQFKQVQEDKQLENNFQFFINDEDFNFWKVLYLGESGTPYSSGYWLLTVEFGSDYPMQPPIVRFQTKVYHCNINDDGKICHQILSSSWAPSVTAKKIFEEIADMMKNPNPGDALDTCKGDLYNTNKTQYEVNIREWKNQYASKSLTEMKLAHVLE